MGLGIRGLSSAAPNKPVAPRMVQKGKAKDAAPGLGQDTYAPSVPTFADAQQYQNYAIKLIGYAQIDEQTLAEFQREAAYGKAGPDDLANATANLRYVDAKLDALKQQGLANANTFKGQGFDVAKFWDDQAKDIPRVADPAPGSPAPAPAPSTQTDQADARAAAMLKTAQDMADRAHSNANDGNQQLADTLAGEAAQLFQQATDAATSADMARKIANAAADTAHSMANDGESGNASTIANAAVYAYGRAPKLTGDYKTLRSVADDAADRAHSMANDGESKLGFPLAQAAGELYKEAARRAPYIETVQDIANHAADQGQSMANDGESDMGRTLTDASAYAVGIASSKRPAPVAPPPPPGTKTHHFLWFSW